MLHPWASLPVMDVLPNTIYASEAFLPLSLSDKNLPRNYVPFVGSPEASSGRLARVGRIDRSVPPPILGISAVQVSRPEA
jgi:hypothetical protein